MALDFFANFLSGRSFVTGLIIFQSDKRPISCVVPQGSNLDPLLFIIYENDFCKLEVDSKISFFADVNSIYYSARSLCGRFYWIEEDLITVQSCFKLNHLEINYNKSKVTCVHKHDVSANCYLEIGCNNIGMVRSFRLLGLTVDNHAGSI